MIQKIKTLENTKPDKILFVHDIDFSVMPDMRVIPLFGANGAGKSTLLQGIKDEITRISEQKECDREIAALDKTSEYYDWEVTFYQRHVKESGIRFEHTGASMALYTYKNGDDNFGTRQAKTEQEAFDPFFIKGRWDARSLSEGQSIMYSAYDLFRGIANPEMLQCEGGECLILIDEFDSGLSIDNIDACMRQLKKALKTRNDIQVFFSFNNPRILKWFPHVFSMYDGNMLEMHSDEDMLNEIRKNAKMLEKARGRRDKFKIYE